MRIALFACGANQPARLLLIVHHLAVDGVSWRVLLEDMQTLYEQQSQGNPLQLPPKTTSFQEWARRLVESSIPVSGDRDRARRGRDPRHRPPRATYAIPRRPVLASEDAARWGR